MINLDIKLISAVGTVLTVISSAVCFVFSPICAVICFCAGIFITVFAAVVNYRRIVRLRELNDYLTLVCSGRYDLDLADNTEGELSILKSNLYKVMVLLRSQNEQLTNDKCMLADSLADISHQLKTPLTSIMMMTDILRNGCDEEKSKKFLSIIENQIEKMRWLITNLLKLSKLDAGTVDLEICENSLSDVIGECVEQFSLMAELKEITIDVNVGNIRLKCDKNWTVEAISNIIKNCIEHTSAGGKITVCADSTSLFDRITIADNGCGISKEDIEHIFDRFYRGSNSSSDSVGIGLALSKAIIEKQCGSIAALSDGETGTSFVIKLYKSVV